MYIHNKKFKFMKADKISLIGYDKDICQFVSSLEDKSQILSIWIFKDVFYKIKFEGLREITKEEIKEFKNFNY